MSSRGGSRVEGDAVKKGDGGEGEGEKQKRGLLLLRKVKVLWIMRV